MNKFEDPGGENNMRTTNFRAHGVAPRGRPSPSPLVPALILVILSVRARSFRCTYYAFRKTLVAAACSSHTPFVLGNLGVRILQQQLFGVFRSRK